MVGSLSAWLAVHLEQERDFIHVRVLENHLSPPRDEPQGTVVLLRAGNILRLVRARPGEALAEVWVDVLGDTVAVPTNNLIPCDESGNDWAW